MKIHSLFTLAASVALITSASASITMDWVNVGYAGNAADTTGRGAVAHDYQIGKYEVTNAQYAAFLNAADPTGANANGIYDGNMGNPPNGRGGITYTAGAASGAKYTLRTNMGDKPVNSVSWYSAARFTNWMNNGQGSGSTETGAYTLSGNTGIITKNVGAAVYLPSADEWYKAAYYDPTPGAGGGDNYWLYATQSNTAPTSATVDTIGNITNPGANVANYNNGADWNVFNGRVENGNVTTVGSAVANNFFGTADQGGNVQEWDGTSIFGSYRISGGSFKSSAEQLAATSGAFSDPTFQDDYVGFRVATRIGAIPEPTSLLLTMLAGGVMLARRKR